MKNNILKLFLLLTVLCVAVMGFTACLLEGVQHDHSTPSEESSISGSEDSDVIPEKETVNVTIPSGEGFAVEGEAIATKGESYEFSVTFMEGYEGGIVKVNGEAVALNAEGKAIVENVTEELIITVEGVTLKVYSVTLPTGSGYTVSGAVSVEHGASYELQFALLEGYEGGIVKVNGEAVALNAEGKAIVENVAEELIITVEGVTLKVYSVTLPTGSGYTVSGAVSVEHGASYELQFALLEGYEGGIVKVNGEAVALNAEGKAIVENVAEELIITVEGVQRMVLSVTFEGEHLTLNGENSVIYSDNYSFVITFESAYEAGADFKVLVNGVELFANAEGEYVIEEAKENIAITVTGAVLKKSAVLEDNEFENEDDWWL